MVTSLVKKNNKLNNNELHITSITPHINSSTILNPSTVVPSDFHRF